MKQLEQLRQLQDDGNVWFNNALTVITVALMCALSSAIWVIWVTVFKNYPIITKYELQNGTMPKKLNNIIN